MTTTQFCEWVRTQRHQIIILHPDDFFDLWRRVVCSKRKEDKQGAYIEWPPYTIRTVSPPLDPTPLNVSEWRLFEEEPKHVEVKGFGRVLKALGVGMCKLLRIQT
jgi:hypothetical protein